jgi:hypothetical protein
MGKLVLPRNAFFIGGKTPRDDRLRIRPRQHCFPRAGERGTEFIRLGSRTLCIPVGIDPNPIPRFSAEIEMRDGSAGTPRMKMKLENDLKERDKRGEQENPLT